MWRALLRFELDCVAHPTIKQAPAAATERLRHFGIGNVPSSQSRQGQAIIYKNSLGLNIGLQAGALAKMLCQTASKDVNYGPNSRQPPKVQSCNAGNVSP